MADWVGKGKAVFTTLGASSHSVEEREENDYYATEPKATELLCELEKFHHTILEPACGEGHIAKELIKQGYTVISSDLVDRGYGMGGCNFLGRYEIEALDVDVITNPPYSKAAEFVYKSLELIKPGRRVAMFLKLTFCEGKERKKLFKDHPPKVIYVSSSRLTCAKNGEFSATDSSAACYAWFIWEKGFKGDTIIKWFN